MTESIDNAIVLKAELRKPESLSTVSSPNDTGIAPKDAEGCKNNKKCPPSGCLVKYMKSFCFRKITTGTPMEAVKYAPTFSYLSSEPMSSIPKVHCRTEDVPKNIKEIEDSYKHSTMVLQSLSDTQIQAVANTWMYTKKCMEKVGAVLFLGIFEKHADFRDAFASFRGKGQQELLVDPALQAHGLRVLNIIDKIISRIHRIDLITNYLLYVGSKHANYVPRLTLVPCVGEQVIDSIKPVLQEADLWTEDAESGWHVVLTFLTHAVQLGIARAARSS